LAKLLRVAQIGGSPTIRKARRDALESGQVAQVVYSGDGFNFTPQELLDLNFDVAVIDHRLPKSSAFQFVIAAQSLAKVSGIDLGRIVVSSQFYELDLRLAAVEAGAVDCVFVEAGIQRFIETISGCQDVDADFGIREILSEIPQRDVSEAEYQMAAVALDTLDAKESSIVKAFCELKTDAQIAQSTQVPKLKVRNTILKVQNLLMLNTRSQLLLKLTRLGALAL
jgi:DNA-binding NarL/FixJ family response regulator